MPIMFNQLLADAGFPLASVRLLRHSNSEGMSAQTLWRDNRNGFILYQSVQPPARRADFGDAAIWASFGSTDEGGTVFLGIYEVSFRGVGKKTLRRPHSSGFDQRGTYHLYDVREAEQLQDLAGRLYIEWGAGPRSWIQRPDRQNKPLIEVRSSLRDPTFPGYVHFIRPISQIASLPQTWKVALGASRGVYLLTCPRTHEQYVGKADGGEGFLGRWLSYVTNGHGGNIKLKSRELSDYQVSILEVAGSASSGEDICAMEARWKQKLQSREMGLNSN